MFRTHAAAALAGAAAAGIAFLFFRRGKRPADTNPGEFVLERYFAEYEFNAKYQICNSDVSSLSLKELLELCAKDQDSLATWENLSLGYTESRGDPALLAEIASCYSEKIALQDVIECVPAEGILLSAQALVQPGDELVVVWPAYQSLFEIARARGAVVHKWAARGGGGERLYFDVDDLAALCAAAYLRGKSIKAIVINFPHNPTGAHLTAAEQARVVEVARACGAFVLSDEMYRGLEYAPSHPTLPAMCEVYERGISLAGMSKVYALPGLRVGWLVSPAANGFIDACARLKDYTTICGSAPSEALALMALRQRDTLLARSRKIVADGLQAAPRPPPPPAPPLRASHRTARSTAPRPHPTKKLWRPPGGRRLLRAPPRPRPLPPPDGRPDLLPRLQGREAHGQGRHGVRARARCGHRRALAPRKRVLRRGRPRRWRRALPRRARPARHRGESGRVRGGAQGLDAAACSPLRSLVYYLS